jgi:hypothetical protein
MVLVFIILLMLYLPFPYIWNRIIPNEIIFIVIINSVKIIFSLAVQLLLPSLIQE